MNPNLSHNISVYEMLGSFLRNRSLIFQMNRREVFRCYRNSVLASLVVYIRDIWQMTSVLTTELLFLSPIFYPASRVPEPYQTIIYIYPLTFVIEQARDLFNVEEYVDLEWSNDCNRSKFSCCLDEICLVPENTSGVC